MKIIFFGTSEFAVPALKKLRETDFKIVAVVTQPDRAAGRKQKPLSSPIKLLAEKLGLDVIQPDKPEELRIENQKLRESDLFVVASYGKIIPKEILEIPKYGALNVHPSLLPRYRGPSPIQAAILNGDQETGVTIIKMDEKMDHGPIVAKSKIKNSPSGRSREARQKSKLGYSELHDKLANLGAKLLLKILPRYVNGQITPLPQDDAQATFTKIITKDDARIDWRNCAEKIDRQIRAYSSWPVAWTTLDGKRVKIFEAEVGVPQKSQSDFNGVLEVRQQKILEGSAGQILEAEKNLAIRCGEESHCKLNVLILKVLQREGGKKLDVATFLRGQRNLKGKILV